MFMYVDNDMKYLLERDFTSKTISEASQNLI